MYLGHLLPERKTGAEPFTVSSTKLDICLLDYWSWAHSDIIDNTERGKIAEFIVATALGVHDKINSSWDSFDLLYRDKGVEVKSAAYLQTWGQERESYISFGAQPTQGWSMETGKLDGNPKRQAHLYVFCLLRHKDKRTLNPLDLDQWQFYVVPTAMLNELAPKLKRVSLSFLQKHDMKPCAYADIRSHVDQIIGEQGEAR